MGVFRQPPYPAQLFGAVAVLFGQVAASPPLTSYSQQQNVAAAYRAPDAYRLPAVFPQQLFPQVVDPVPLKAPDPQTLVAATWRSAQASTQTQAFQPHIFGQVINAAPLKAVDPQVLAAAAYRLPFSYPLQVDYEYSPQVFATATTPDSPPLAGYAQQAVAATYRPAAFPQQRAPAIVDILDLYTQDSAVGQGDVQTLAALTLRPLPPMPARLQVPFDALFPPPVQAPFPFTQPYQPASAYKPQGNGQPPAVFPSQLFPQALDPVPLQKPGRGPVVAAYGGLPAYPSQPIPFPAQLFPTAAPDSPPIAGPEPQQLAKAGYRPLDAYRTPPVFPAQVFPPIVNTPPLQLSYQQQNAATAYRTVPPNPTSFIFPSQLFPSAPAPVVIASFPDANDSSRKHKKPYNSIYSIQERANRAHADELEKAKAERVAEIQEAESVTPEIAPILEAIQEEIAEPAAERIAEAAEPLSELQDSPAPIEAAPVESQEPALSAAPLVAAAPEHDDEQDVIDILNLLQQLGHI